MHETETAKTDNNDSLAEDINVANEVEQYIAAALPEAEVVDDPPMTFIGLPSIQNIVLYDKKTMKSAKQIEIETKIQDEDEKEEMILKAAKHVKIAKQQHEYVNKKIRLAVKSNSTPIEQRSHHGYY
jgi:hypothetical protein